MTSESQLEKALNRLLWKMPKPPGCETAEDVARWLMAELVDAGITVEWNAEEQKIVKGKPKGQVSANFQKRIEPMIAIDPAAYLEGWQADRKVPLGDSETLLESICSEWPFEHRLLVLKNRKIVRDVTPQSWRDGTVEILARHQREQESP